MSDPRKQTDAERARALLLPVSEPQGAQDLDGDGVPAVLPGRPAPQQPPTRPAAAAEESGITCWNCGVGNRTDRTFCRNCGAELHNPPPAAAAPPPRRNTRKLLLIIGAIVLTLALLAGAVFAITALIRARADNEINVPPPNLVKAPPVAAEASVQDPKHPPQNAFDGVSDSWWGTGREGDSRGAVIQADYSQPINLRAVRIFPGVSTDPADRDQQARPQQIQVVVTDAQGRRSVGSYKLSDGEALLVEMDAPNTRRVQFVLESAYGAQPGKQVAVCEIELFRNA
ncbi:zinc ribbon domain-containing protein [Winogradskya humida]|uniref:Zinc-ribbon domain-containing protein n=1 Tax=Winogradskya humida TaxID=113566 RepID=A0ABQ3ZP21_9ACTN|nr:zinc ribbon domain-containing protein [Actinoplanes humidus]GIE20308.1 hypothetical protein Ahu01nite_034100 [Actinoplanes humidus]